MTGRKHSGVSPPFASGRVLQSNSILSGCNPTSPPRARRALKSSPQRERTSSQKSLHGYIKNVTQNDKNYHQRVEHKHTLQHQHCKDLSLPKPHNLHYMYLPNEVVERGERDHIEESWSHRHTLSKCPYSFRCMPSRSFPVYASPHHTDSVQQYSCLQR